MFCAPFVYLHKMRATSCRGIRTVLCKGSCQCCLLQWVLMLADISSSYCCMAGYESKNISQIMHTDRPYIVSDANDWDPLRQTFTSTCGGEVCAGNLGYVETFNTTVTIVLRINIYTGDGNIVNSIREGSMGNVPKLEVTPFKEWFVDSSLKPIFKQGIYDGSWKSGALYTGGGYVQFVNGNFMAASVGGRFDISSSTGFTIIFHGTYPSSVAFGTVLLTMFAKVPADDIVITNAGNSWNIKLQGCHVTLGTTFSTHIWSTLVIRYETSTNTITTLLTTALSTVSTSSRLRSSAVCPANSVRNPTYRTLRVLNALKLAALLVTNAYLTENEIEEIRLRINLGEDIYAYSPWAYKKQDETSIPGVPIAYLGGSILTKMQWGALSVPTRFTICSVGRYSGRNRNMILGCVGNPQGALNFVHGHQGGIAGATRYGPMDSTNWSPTSLSPNTQWVVVCGRNTNTKDNASVIVNRMIRAFATVPGASACALGINQDVSHRSDWQISKLYVWNYHLSNEIFSLVSSSLNDALVYTQMPELCTRCPRDTFSLTNGPQCLRCAPNSASNNDNTACRCNAGYEPASATNTTCVSCSVGKYKNTNSDLSAETDVCIPCLQDRTSPVGSINVTSCVCKGGFSGMDPDKCVQCPMGKYKEPQ